MRISDWSSDVCSSDLGHRPGRAAIAGTGLASGVLTGFAAMPGPPVVPFYLRRHLAPKVARASMLLTFFGTAIAGTLAALWVGIATRSEENTSELQSLMRRSNAVFWLKKRKKQATLVQRRH